jgi:ATP-dependent RNA helicase DHX29
MAKKKKTQLKPVVRGFATTSVPKKTVVVEADASQDSQNPNDVLVNSEGSRPDDTVQDQSNDSLVQCHAGSDSDKEQEATLQSLVDRLQERTEKDILRTLKVWQPGSRMLYLLIFFQDDRDGKTTFQCTSSTGAGCSLG